MTTVPSGMYDVQIQLYQVCNCDEVIFEPNSIQNSPVTYPEGRRKKKHQPNDNIPNAALKVVYHKKNMNGQRDSQLQNLHHHM